MKKRSKYILTFLLFAVCLTGCQEDSGTDGQEIKENKEPAATHQEEYEYTSEKLSMSFKMELPDTLPQYQVTAVTVDFTDYAEAFLEQVMPDMDYRYTEKDGYDNDGNTTVLKSWENVSADHYWTSCTSNGICLVCYCHPRSVWGDMQYALRLYRDFYYEDYGYPDSVRNNSALYLDKELDFASSKDAQLAFTDALKSAGVDITGGLDVSSYGMDAETAQQEWYYEDDMGNVLDKPDFSGMTDMYYLLARQEIDGLPVLYYGSGSLLDIAYEESVPIEIVYSEDGLDIFKIRRMFAFERTGEEYGDFVDCDTAADVVKLLYENLLGDSTYRVDSAGLFYYAKRQGDGRIYELIPAWVFQVDEYDHWGRYTGTNPCLVNAVTGEEMEYVQ